MNIRIVVSGPAILHDDEGNEITAHAVLKKMDGMVDSDALPIADFLDPPLCDLGLRGGTLELELDSKRRLRVVSRFRSPKRLTAREQLLLLEETVGQWSDGVGEDAFKQLERSDLAINLAPGGATTTSLRIHQEPDKRGAALKESPALRARCREGDLAGVKRLLSDGSRPDAMAINEAILNKHESVALLLVDTDTTRDFPEAGLLLRNAAMGGMLRLVKALRRGPECHSMPRTKRGAPRFGGRPTGVSQTLCKRSSNWEPMCTSRTPIGAP